MCLVVSFSVILLVSEKQVVCVACRVERLDSCKFFTFCCKCQCRSKDSVVTNGCCVLSGLCFLGTCRFPSIGSEMPFSFGNMYLCVRIDRMAGMDSTLVFGYLGDGDFYYIFFSSYFIRYCNWSSFGNIYLLYSYFVSTLAVCDRVGIESIIF